MSGLSAAVAPEERIARASRRFALISGLGIILVLSALFYSAYELERLSTEIGVRSADLEGVKSELASANRELASTRTQLAASREAVSLVSQGINYFHAGMYAPAINAYDNALKLDSKNPYIANLKGYSLFKAKRLDESLGALQQAVTIDPTYAWGFFDLARVSCAKRDFKGAEHAVGEALRIRSELKATMLSDGEFTRLCQPILPFIQEYKRGN